MSEFQLIPMQTREVARLQCSRCGEAVFAGEGYYTLGDGCYCAQCLPQVARALLLPYLRVAGEEAGRG